MKYLKITLLFSCILCLSNLTNAFDLSGLKIGLKVAPQLTWGVTDNKNTTTSGVRPNMGYGLMVDYYFTNNYALATELCINTYGVNLEVKNTKYDYVEYGSVKFTNTDNVKLDYRLQYIQVPLLLRMRTNGSNRLAYYAEFGFGFGLLTRARADVTFKDQSLTSVKVNEPDPQDDYMIYHNAGNTSSPNYQSYKDDVFELRTSLIMGGGIHYALTGNSTLVTGLRYDNAFSSFTTDDKWFTKLYYLALNVGIIF